MSNAPLPPVLSFLPQFSNAEVCPSPNFGERRGGMRPNALILHYTGMESGEGAQAWLCTPESEVSCHYIVHEDGRVVQMVREEHRAWHAGRGSWQGVEDVNSFSIGIEIVNPGHHLGYPEFPEPQIEAVIALGKDVCERNCIPAERVLAHSDVAPGRKIDPGEKFPWKKLAEAGLGQFVTPRRKYAECTFGPGDRGEAVEILQSRLARYGYGIAKSGVYDDATRIIVQEFQRHFRPERVDGLADPSTRDILRLLIEHPDIG